MSFIITEIYKQLKLESFNCQNDKVNDFLHRYALYNNQNLISKVYVLVEQDTKDIAGVISISAYRLNLPHSEKYSLQQVPAALLGRIGIDDRYRGQDLARVYLIKYILGLCNEVKNYIGLRLLIVEVEKGDPIKAYLIKNGFQEEKSNKKFHFLSIDLLNRVEDR